MTTITNKMQFDILSAKLCGRMISSDSATRVDAAKEAESLLSELPKFLRNSPHCQGEIEAMNTLISKVFAEQA